MKDDSIELPTTSTPTGYVRATLAIPEDAVRVIASPPETLTQRNVEAVTGLSPRVYLEVIRTPTFPLRVAKCYRSTYLMAFRSSSAMAIMSVRAARRVRDGHRVRERMGTHRDAHRACERASSRIVMVIGQHDADAPAA